MRNNNLFEEHTCTRAPYLFSKASRISILPESDTIRLGDGKVSCEVGHVPRPRHDNSIRPGKLAAACDAKPTTASSYSSDDGNKRPGKELISKFFRAGWVARTLTECTYELPRTGVYMLRHGRTSTPEITCNSITGNMLRSARLPGRIEEHSTPIGSANTAGDQHLITRHRSCHCRKRTDKSLKTRGPQSTGLDCSRQRAVGECTW